MVMLMMIVTMTKFDEEEWYDDDDYMMAVDIITIFLGAKKTYTQRFYKLLLLRIVSCNKALENVRVVLYETKFQE